MSISYSFGLSHFVRRIYIDCKFFVSYIPNSTNDFDDPKVMCSLRIFREVLDDMVSVVIFFWR